MSKHTKVRWKLHDMEDNVVVGEDFLTIADVNARNRTPEENQANARLIVASPKMYFALKTIIDLGDIMVCPSIKKFAKEAIRGL